jgi:KipI family sensor histidine kinase inhibitor
LTYPRARPLGEAALTLELGSSVDPALNARVRGIDEQLRREPFPGLREAVPALSSLLVVYEPDQIGFEQVQQELERRARGRPVSAPPGRLHRIPVVYDGADLEDLARARGLSRDEVVRLHSDQEYTAYMLGFLPGFAYLGAVPEALAVPRRANPRVRVPAGSVAIVGGMTAIYPAASPGGWNLIGRTTAPLFDPLRDPPSLIQSGDRVRFARVPDLPAPSAGPAARPATRSASPPIAEVLDGGLLTTVQDLGRFGHRRHGVPWAGAMDPAALRAANLVLGNAPGAAALECAVAGPVLRFLAPVRLAVTGADLGAVLQREDLGAWPVPPGMAVLARPGNRLLFTGRRSGCRAYLAVAGGIDVPEVLGSRATDLGSAFGGLDGRALRAGDHLAAGPSRDTRPREGPLPSSAGAHAGTPTLHVVLGPQDDHLTPESVARFLAGEYRVAAASDRVGCRLQGPSLEPARGGEIPSDGMVPGSVQVPPDGQPIVAMADGPTTGGYPKVATVIGADLPLLAQIVGGEGAVRFAAVSVEDAQRAARAARREEG